MTDPSPMSTRRARFERALTGGREAVAAELDRVRRSRGLSYRDLARQTGVVIATLQGWLSGRYVPQVGMREKFWRLAVVLDVADRAGVDGGVGIVDWWNALRDNGSRAREAYGGSPYPGMRPFDLSTAAEYAGRGDAREALRERIERRLNGEEPPILLLTGRSGVGKSSLVAAAVSTVTPARSAVIVWPSPAAETALSAAREQTEDAPDIIVLDQAESLWTLPDAALATRLLDDLAFVQEHCANTAVIVVARADAMASLTDVAVLRDALERHSFVLGPITADDAREIVVEPTARRGVSLAPELVEMILSDVGVKGHAANAPVAESLVGALPLLSQTMRTLWDQRADPTRIDAADYVRTGSVATSIESAAESAYDRLSPEAQAACWPVLREMLRLDTAPPSRRAVARTRFGDTASVEVISTLREAHLLITDDTEVVIAHDLILRAWPRLDAWLASAHEWSIARRMLARYAVFWDESGRPADLLNAGNALGIIEAQQHDAGSPADAALSLTEHEFVEASRDAHEGRLRAANAENARLRSSRRRLRAAILVAAVSLVVSLILGGVAGSTAVSLDAASTDYRSQELAARAQVVSETMPAEGAQLAIAAHAVRSNQTTDSNLLSLTAQPQPRRLTSTEGPGALATIDGVIAQGGAEHTVRLIDADTGAIRATITTPQSHTYALDLVDAGGRRLLAATGEDVAGDPAQACVWNVAGVPQLVGCVTVPSKSDSVTILPDGSGALFGGADGTIQRLQITPTATRVLTPIDGPRRDDGSTPTAVMGLASAGRTVLAAGRDGTIATLTDPLGDARWSAPAVVPARAQSVTLSDDGSRFAIPTQAFTLALGAVDPDGAPQLTATAHGFESWANSATFLADGGVAGVASDQTLRIFTSDGVLVKTQLLSSLPTSVVRSGTMLATYMVNGTTTLWPNGSLPMASSRGRVFDIATDAAGTRTVATLGSGDGILHVTRLLQDGTRKDLSVPDPHILTRYGVAVSPDGRFVVSAGYGAVLVWRVGEDALSDPTVLTDVLPGALMTEVDYSPDGTRIAVGDQSMDHVVILGIEDDPEAPGAGVRLSMQSRVPVTTGGSMAFSDDDTLVIDDGTRSLLVWDLVRGVPVGSVAFGDVQPVAIARRPSHPGQIAYTTESLQVGIVDVSDPSSPRMLASVAGLTATPRDVAFSSDGSRLSIATVDHVEVREVSENGQSIGPIDLTLTGPMRTEITSAKFVSGDSKMVASTFAGLLWWWDLDASRAVATICSQVGDPLQIAEATSLAPSIPENITMCG